MIGDNIPDFLSGVGFLKLVSSKIPKMDRSWRRHLANRDEYTFPGPQRLLTLLVVVQRYQVR